MYVYARCTILIGLFDAKELVKELRQRIQLIVPAVQLSSKCSLVLIPIIFIYFIFCCMAQQSPPFVFSVKTSFESMLVGLHVPAPNPARLQPFFQPYMRYFVKCLGKIQINYIYSFSLVNLLIDLLKELWQIC